MRNKIIRLALNPDTEYKMLEDIMHWRGIGVPQDMLRFMISETHKQEKLDGQRYSQKTPMREINNEKRVAKIKELEKLSPQELHAELLALGYFDPPEWTDPLVSGLKMSYEVREINNEMTLGVLYTYASGDQPNWNPTLSLSEIVKELIKKKLI